MRFAVINSKRKGANGERSFRDLLRSFGFVARRGQQHSGTPDSPDVVCPELPIRFEVKFGATHSVDAAFRQADDETRGGDIPVVASKRNYSEWMVYLRAQDFLEIVRRSDIILEKQEEIPKKPSTFKDAYLAHQKRMREWTASEDFLD